MRRARFAILVLAACAAALLGACTPTVRERIPAERPAAPEDFPAAFYEQLKAQGETVYRVERDESIVSIEVRRAGSLARFGHDHVVASHDVSGYVARDAGRADLYIALDRLVVDEPSLRADAQFDTQLSAADIAGTRDNMLETVLETGKFPFALIGVSGPARQGGSALDVAITLHGIKRMLRVPVWIELGADDIRVSGRFSFEQSDFGITPFSILGGAVAVQDRVDLRFWIRAR